MMKSEWFRLWVKSCEEFGQTIYRLEKDGEDTGLYLTIKRYIWGEYNPYCDPLDKWHYYYPERYYHVWINGNQIDVVDDDYPTALALYRNELKRWREEQEMSNADNQ